VAIDFEKLIAETEGRIGAISKRSLELRNEAAALDAELYRLEGDHRTLIRLRDAEHRGDTENKDEPHE